MWGALAVLFIFLAIILFMIFGMLYSIRIDAHTKNYVKNADIKHFMPPNKDEKIEIKKDKRYKRGYEYNAPGNGNDMRHRHPALNKKIVGIVKPRGFWTKLILSQKLSFILAKFTAKNSTSSGFWRLFVKTNNRHTSNKHNMRM